MNTYIDISAIKMRNCSFVGFVNLHDCMFLCYIKVILCILSINLCWQSVIADKENRIEELEEALRESIRITAQREVVMAEQQMKLEHTERVVCFCCIILISYSCFSSLTYPPTSLPFFFSSLTSFQFYHQSYY